VRNPFPVRDHVPIVGPAEERDLGDAVAAVVVNLTDDGSQAPQRHCSLRRPDRSS
jgi:hypothetical protein